jgi:hypothetical protein
MPPHQPSNNKKEFARIQAEIDRRMLQVYKAITLEAHKRIVMRTPVASGRARGNWMIDNTPTDKMTDETDKSGSKTLKQAKTYTKSLTIEDKTWIVNNVSYIGVLENGGYPNPPKRGSWIRGKGYVVKSSGGYSRQAPHGMVKVTMAELKALLPGIIQQARASVE